MSFCYYLYIERNVPGFDLQKKYKEETEIENLIQKYDGEMGEKQVDLN